MTTLTPTAAGNPLSRGLSFLAGKPGWAFLLIFSLSFSVQAFLLTRVSDRYVVPHTRWELPAVAVALAERGEFADPYLLPTGPTAHLPPIPPAIFALSYEVFGLTPAGGYAAWLANMAIYAGLLGMLPWLAGSIGLGSGTGVIAGLAGSLIPHWPGHGEGLAALALGLLMVAFALRWRKQEIRAVHSIVLGIACGIAFHVQPALLPVVLGWMAFEVWMRRGKLSWIHPGLIGIGILVACLPWGWRNYQTFDAVFFIRSNLGLELRMGNHDGAAASMDAMDRQGEHRHPRTHEAEARTLQEMGEVHYMRAAREEAVSWIYSNPGPFIKLTASRVVLWWFGPLYYPPGAALATALTLLAFLGVWLALPGLEVPDRAAVLIPLFTYPLIYYVVAYMPRYRQPIDWLFLLLACAAAVRLRPLLTKTSS